MDDMTWTGDADGGARIQVIDVAALGQLHVVLREAGYQVIGPTVRDGAIVLAELASADELPFGWGVQLAPGRYQVTPRSDGAAFGHSAGPQSWKNFLHPPRAKLWSVRRSDGAVHVHDEPVPKLAFIGVRPCDLRAIQIQDRVLGAGQHASSRYAARRAAIFVVAVNCTEPGDTCFCASMGTGPGAESGYDLALTELAGPGEHLFLVDVGSPAGAEILGRLPVRPADQPTTRRARTAVKRAAEMMVRSMPADVLHDLMAGSYPAARWNEVAERCLTCGNCTMACPTCFCTTVQDVSEVSGEHAERWQTWDSCFSLSFSYLPGGPVRESGHSRYRQWLTHKLGTWHDQFGTSGCVGCGRCIVWCPVGIDLTEEVAALQSEAGQAGQGEAARGAGGRQ